MIRLGANIAALLVQRHLGSSTREVSGAMERLASGLRINRAADDAAGLAVGMQLGASARLYTGALRNLNDGVSALSVAQGTLESASNIVMRLKELAGQAANGSYSIQQRRALDSEANALINEFNRQVRSTSFNGISLLNGSMRISLQAGWGAGSTLGLDVGAQISRSIGTGTFTRGAVTGTTSAVRGMTSADFNGDGRLDIAVVNNSQLLVSFGDGAGGFAAPTTYATGIAPYQISSADLNGDGKADIAVANLVSSTVGVYINNGSGGFGAATNYGMGASLNDVSLADINGDGKVDMIASNSGNYSAQVRLGNGNGTFSASTTGYDMRVNTFAATLPNRIKTYDINGDGRLDLIAGTDNSSEGLTVRLQKSDGTFAAATAVSGFENLDIAFGDFNHDGIIDIIGTDGSSVGLYAGKGDGTFAARTTVTSSAVGSSITAGDFNSDGYLDWASGNVVYAGDGAGAFSLLGSIAPSGDSNFATVAGDFNGDGVLDIAAGRNGGGGIYAQLNNAQSSAVLGQIDLLTAANARSALEGLEAVATRLARELGDIGASQSRVESALRTVSAARENSEAAYSRIMDADVAMETASLVKNKILQQAASSVLAQANLAPSLALTLLGVR